MIKKMFNYIISHVPESIFIKNILILMSGSFFVQCLAFMASFFLARLYTPEEFGILSIYSAVLGILSVIVCGRYDQAVVLPEKEEDAKSIAFLAILISFCSALAAIPLVIFFGNKLSAIINSPQIASLMWLLPISLLAAGIYQTFDYWNSRRGKFKRMAARQISQTSITLVSQLGFGLTVLPGHIGLIMGAFLGQISATIHLVFQTLNEEGKEFWRGIKLEVVKEQLLRYKRFPLYSSWADLLNTGSSMMPLFLLGYFFTPEVIGYYSWGQRLLAVPMGIIGVSLSQVFFPRANQAKLDNNLDRFSLKVFSSLLELGFVPAMLFIIIAPDFFVLLFGEQWIISGYYARWLCLWLLFQFVSSPISTIYLVMERQHILMIFNAVLLVLRLLSVIIGGILGSAMLTIILLGISGMFMYIVNAILILRQVGISLNIIIKEKFTIIFKSMPYLIVPLLLYALDANTWVLISSIVLSLALKVILFGKKFSKLI
ncbi:MAG: oligosaccharide flippase family protein [Bacillota bacterium]